MQPCIGCSKHVVGLHHGPVYHVQGQRNFESSVISSIQSQATSGWPLHCLRVQCTCNHGCQEDTTTHRWACHEGYNGWCRYRGGVQAVGSAVASRISKMYIISGVCLFLRISQVYLTRSCREVPPIRWVLKSLIAIRSENKTAQDLR